MKTTEEALEDARRVLAEIEAADIERITVGWSLLSLDDVSFDDVSVQRQFDESRRKISITIVVRNNSNN